MAGVILVPQDLVKNDTTAATSASETGLRTTDEAASNNSWESDSQSSNYEFEGLHAALEDRRDGSAAVRRLELSRIADKPSLFHELAELLTFDHPRVRSECGGLIARIIPQLEYGVELDKCMSIVMPRLVHNLGHPEPEVRVSAASSLVVYLRMVEDEKSVMHTLVEQGLLHSSPTIRRNIIANLSLLFVSELSDKNWQEVVLCLVSVVVQQQEPQTESLAALQSLRTLIGDERFRFYLKQMSVHEKQNDGDFHLEEITTSRQYPTGFGFIEPDVIDMLRERDNWKARVHGMEELKLAVKNVPNVTVLLNELPLFLKFLAELSADINFKVVLITLEIYGVLVDKLKWQIAPHLDSVVNVLVRLLGESKIVVRSQSAKVLHSLMHCAGPSSVVTLLCGYLETPGNGKQASSKTHEEILNAIILALLTFPSYDFDLVAICTAVAPVLFDPKCRVRQAALECLAVLAQAMGSSKLATVAKSIDDVARRNPSYNTETALAAVLARLARRQLPRITPDGQVEYSVRIPSGSGVLGRSSWAGHGIFSFPHGADIDWILAGSGSLGLGSPRPRNSNSTVAITDISDVQTTLSKHQSASFPSSPVAPRRIVSPGHSKDSLPWNEVRSTIQRMTSGSNSEAGHSGVSRESQQQQIEQFNEDHHYLPQVASASRKTRSVSQELPISGFSRSGSRTSSGFNGGHSWATIPESNNDSNTTKSSSGHSQSLDSSLRSGVGTSNGMIYSLKQPAADRASYRPLDKVAAMLGSNILPNKLRPVIGESHHDRVGSTIVALPSSFNPSSTWPGTTSGSLPALPQKRKVLGPITDLRDAPIPTRPTLLRSSSGSKRSRVPPIGQVTLNGSPAAVRSEVPKFPHGIPSPSHPPQSVLPNEPKPKLVQDPGRKKSGTTFDSALRSPFKNSLPCSLSENQSLSSNTSNPVVVGRPRRNRCPLESDDENDSEQEVRLRREDSYTQGSVDSGVGSLARPRSRSSVVSVPRRRPRSLDFHTTFSMHKSDSGDTRGGGDGEVSPSSSGSQNRLWSDDEDEEEGYYERGRTGNSSVRNRAVSEVSSLTSSLEQLPNSESPPFRTLSPLPLAPGQSKHPQWNSEELENDNKGDHTAILNTNRVQSTVSWEHELPTPPPDVSRQKSGRNREQSQEDDSVKFKDDLLTPAHYCSKPALIHSLSLQRLKQVSPISTQTTNAPFVNGLTSTSTNTTTTVTSILRKNIPPTRSCLGSPKTHTDDVLLSSSRNVNVRSSEGITINGKAVPPQQQHRLSDAGSIYAVSPPPPITSPPIPTHRNSRTDQQEDGERNQRSASRSGYLPSIEGRSVSHMAQDSSLDGGSFSTEDEDPNAMSLSQSTLSKMMSRRMEMMKEAERRKQDRQKLQEQKKVWVNGHEKGGRPGFRPRTPPGKPIANRRRPRHTGAMVQNNVTVVQNTKNSPSTAHSNEVDDRLLKNPDEAVRTALAKLQSDEWSVKCEGIKILGSVCTSHPAALHSELHRINMALLVEVKNLRSTVSRSAIQVFALLFASAKKNMESDLEAICHVLLHKSGESNVFIKEDVEKALVQMVENVSPQKAAAALILGGATHRNTAVRKTTAQFLSLACEKLGPNRILSGTKDITDRIIPTAAQFLMDGSPLTRYYGRKIFFMLLPNTEFDKVLKQHTQPSTLRNIQDILDGLKTKGLGTIPNESAASRHLKGLK